MWGGVIQEQGIDFEELVSQASQRTAALYACFVHRTAPKCGFLHAGKCAFGCNPEIVSL